MADAVDVLPLPEINREDLLFSGALSAGAYGAVYKAKWISRRLTVAVKRVFLLEKEAKILSLLRHKNIIQFYGVCSVSPDFGIVTEYAENGSLYDLLSNESYDDLSVDHVLSWAMDIAEGINYLHTQTQTVILHRDLKSKNVVIDGDWVCKLCDFGTSKVYTTRHTTAHKTVAGTVPWMSPEMISQKSEITEATDIWSYAVVLWELLTREQPFKGLTEYRIATMIVEQGVRLTIPNQCPTALVNLINDCWLADPSERPTSTDVVTRLRAIADDDNISKETEMFCVDKQSWKREIDTHLEILKAKEQELSIKEQELARREEKLSARELVLLKAHKVSFHSQQQLQDILTDDVSTWPEESVCAWLSSLPLNIRQEELTVLHSKIKEHHINGRRLVLLTDADLCHMGFVSIGHRRQIGSAISELCRANQRMRNFPSLADSQKQLRVEHEYRQSPIRHLERVVDVTFILGVHCRRVPGTERYRWKLYVDADWSEPSAYFSDLLYQQTNHHHNNWFSQPQPQTSAVMENANQLLDANALVQNLTVYFNLPVMNGAQKVGEPVASNHFPFLLTHWLDAPIDLDENDHDHGIVLNHNGIVNGENGFERHPGENGEQEQRDESRIQVVISFSDLVSQPRNTRLYHSLTDYRHDRILLERVIPMTLRPAATLIAGAGKRKTSAVGNQHVSLHSVDSVPKLKGEWATRTTANDASVLNNTTSPSPVKLMSQIDSQQTPPSRAWADIAAGLRSGATSSMSAGASPLTGRKTSVPTPTGQYIGNIQPPLTHHRGVSADATGDLGMQRLVLSSPRHLSSTSSHNGGAPLRTNNSSGSTSSTSDKLFDLTPSPDVRNASRPVWNAAGGDSSGALGLQLSPVDERSSTFGGGVALPANSSVGATSASQRRAAASRDRRRNQNDANKTFSGRVHGGYQKWTWKS